MCDGINGVYPQFGSNCISVRINSEKTTCMQITTLRLCEFQWAPRTITLYSSVRSDRLLARSTYWIYYLLEMKCLEAQCILFRYKILVFTNNNPKLLYVTWKYVSDVQLNHKIALAAHENQESVCDILSDFCDVLKTAFSHFGLSIFIHFDRCSALNCWWSFTFSSFRN